MVLFCLLFPAPLSLIYLSRHHDTHISQHTIHDTLRPLLSQTLGKVLVTHDHDLQEMRGPLLSTVSCNQTTVKTTVPVKDNHS